MYFCAIMEFNPEEFRKLISDRKVKFHADKEKCEKITCKISVHIDGTYPKDLIDDYRPNEEEATKKYREENYEPITQGIISQSIDGLYRIFNTDHYSISSSKEVTEFIGKATFKDVTFMEWVKKFGVYYMIKDPNGYLVVLPSIIPEEESKSVTPSINYVSSCDIIQADKDAFIWEEKNASLVKVGTKQLKEGKIYHILTPNTYYQIVQFGEKHLNKYRIDIIYNYNFGEIPAFQLKGIWVENLGVWDSFFRNFIPFANDAVRCYSDTQAIRVTCSYPFREVVVLDCDNEGCENGYIYGDKDIPCEVCKGKGYKDMSPYGKWIRTPNSQLFDDNRANDMEPIRFFSPKVDILTHNEQNWKDLLKFAGKGIHLVEPDESLSGIAKLYDKEREYAWILNISDNIFENIIYNSLTYFEKYLNPVSQKPVQVNKPSQFAIKTELDILNELSILVEKQAPEYIIKESIIDFINKKFAGNPVLRKVHLFLLWADILYTKTVAEKQYLNNVGLISKSVYDFHLYGFTVINYIAINEPTKLDLGFFELYVYASELMKKLIPKEEAPVNPIPNTNIPQ